jgi:hypothetical protein
LAVRRAAPGGQARGTGRSGARRRADGDGGCGTAPPAGEQHERAAEEQQRRTRTG